MPRRVRPTFQEFDAHSQLNTFFRVLTFAFSVFFAVIGLAFLGLDLRPLSTCFSLADGKLFIHWHIGLVAQKYYKPAGSYEMTNTFLQRFDFAGMAFIQLVDFHLIFGLVKKSNCFYSSVCIYLQRIYTVHCLLNNLCSCQSN